MTKEYGYTITVKGESKEVVLGEGSEEELKDKIQKANEVEQGPNIRGLVRPSNTVWWVREKK